MNESLVSFRTQTCPFYSGAGIDQMGRDGILVQVDCIAYID